MLDTDTGLGSIKSSFNPSGPDLKSTSPVRSVRSWSQVRFSGPVRSADERTTPTIFGRGLLAPGVSGAKSRRSALRSCLIIIFCRGLNNDRRRVINSLPVTTFRHHVYETLVHATHAAAAAVESLLLSSCIMFVLVVIERIKRIRISGDRAHGGVTNYYRYRVAFASSRDDVFLF